jgi:hypothetical protein
MVAANPFALAELTLSAGFDVCVVWVKLATLPLPVFVRLNSVDGETVTDENGSANDVAAVVCTVESGNRNPPAREAMTPLTWRGNAGAWVPIPTFPVFVMIILSVFAVRKRRAGFGAMAPESGRTLMNPDPRPNDAPE